MRASSVDQIILATLAESDQHLSAHEIYDIIRKKLPAVNPSTVYRALDRLAGVGKISVSDMGIGAEVYESTEHGVHHHFVCQTCGKISTIHDSDIRGFFNQLQNQYQFEITTNHLVLFGICQDCKTVESQES